MNLLTQFLLRQGTKETDTLVYVPERGEFVWKANLGDVTRPDSYGYEKELELVREHAAGGGSGGG